MTTTLAPEALALVGTHRFDGPAQAHEWLTANGWKEEFDIDVGLHDPRRWWHPDLGCAIEHEGEHIDGGWYFIIDREIDHRRGV